jgi:hypothetical protein
MEVGEKRDIGKISVSANLIDIQPGRLRWKEVWIAEVEGVKTK